MTELPTVLALYLALGLPILTILLVEHKIPYRRQWKMNASDLVKDIRFAFLNHVLLDRILKFSVIYFFPAGFINYLSHFPILIQVFIMLVIAEFSRYWLHRMMHTNEFLWQFHKVHHTPKKLHASNVVWVHPADKIFQFCADTLPFLLIGISDLSLAIYFIFYTIHGFFQHSNLPIKLGILNKIFSGPELHRWHHSVDPQIANHNFGNNLIMWDQIFGTYYNPKKGQVGELGIVGQENAKNALGSIFGVLLDQTIGKIHWLRYSKACLNPKNAQIRTLKKIIRKNKKTKFSRFHGIDKFTNIMDFRRNVKPQEYEYFSKYIKCQDLDKSQYLTATSANFFASTSGTTGKMKLIPLTSAYKKQLRRHQVLAARMIRRLYPTALKGKLLVVASPTIDGYTDSHTPYGSISGFIQQNTPKLIRNQYIGAKCLYEIDDYGVRYQALALVALLNPECSLWAAANPSTFLKIIETIKENEKTLVDSLVLQHVDSWNVPQEVKDYLKSLLSKNIQKGLSKKLKIANTKQSYDSIWPKLDLILTWTCGSCAVTLNKLLRYFENPPKVMDLGLIASEGRMTLPFTRDSGGIPTLKEVFYEFVEKDSWERGKQRFLLLNELELGKQYYIFLTTSYGLYRYHINDVVEVSGFFKKTPLLKFTQKGVGVTNITGEKLCEAQVIKALNQVKDIVVPRFFIALANVEHARYELYIEGDFVATNEDLDQLIDAQLCALNIEYQAKRESGRLKPLILKKLNCGVGELYKEYLLSLGQRESQFKYLAIFHKSDMKFDFESYVSTVA